jgi:hypothetical protein
MSLRKFSTAASIGLAGLLMVALSPAARAQQLAFAIANGGTTLISFQTNAPGAASARGNFTLNGQSTFLDAIDFRPQTGQLYGYLDATDSLYLVNTANASLTLVASGSGASATNTNLLGMDYNPTIDRVRVVTDSGQNLVYNPNSSAAPTVNTPLFYPAGDPGANAPLGARIIENAYDRNIASAFLTTTQYGIDYGTDTLVTINNNAGTLTTIGSLGLNINDSAPFVGFDIFTAYGGVNGVNTAYGIFDTTPGAAPGFYTVNLGTGAATSVGAIGGGFTQVYSLAVTPTSAVAPEPTSAALALLGSGGLAMVGIARRRRR